MHLEKLGNSLTNSIYFIEYYDYIEEKLVEVDIHTKNVNQSSNCEHENVACGIGLLIAHVKPSYSNDYHNKSLSFENKNDFIAEQNNLLT